MPDGVSELAREIVEKLGSGQVAEVFAAALPGGMPEEVFREQLVSYEVTLAPPPPDADLDVRVYGGGEIDRVPTWAIDVPVWTREEGRSDLTLQLRITRHADGLKYIVEDLHVL